MYSKKGTGVLIIGKRVPDVLILGTGFIYTVTRVAVCWFSKLVTIVALCSKKGSSVVFLEKHHSGFISRNWLTIVVLSFSNWCP